jgi:hypothetical protein
VLHQAAQEGGHLLHHPCQVLQQLQGMGQVDGVAAVDGPVSKGHAQQVNPLPHRPLLLDRYRQESQGSMRLWVASQLFCEGPPALIRLTTATAAAQQLLKHRMLDDTSATKGPTNSYTTHQHKPVLRHGMPCT